MSEGKYSVDFLKMLIFNWYLERVPRDEMKGANLKVQSVVSQLFQCNPPWLEGLGASLDVTGVEGDLRQFAKGAFPVLMEGEANPY